MRSGSRLPLATFIRCVMQGSEFEGGYRVAAFVSGGAVPPAVRGTIQVPCAARWCCCCCCYCCSRLLPSHGCVVWRAGGHRPRCRLAWDPVPSRWGGCVCSAGVLARACPNLTRPFLLPQAHGTNALLTPRLPLQVFRPSTHLICGLCSRE